MRIMAILVFAGSCALSGVAASRPGRTSVQGDLGCGVLESAIHDYERIKPGATRSDVEKLFIRDGGLQFIEKSRYTYRGCRFLHVDVDYKLQEMSGHKTSPDDLVDAVSRLYVDYPAKD